MMKTNDIIWLVGRSGRLGSAIEGILKRDSHHTIIGTDEKDVDISVLSQVEQFAEQMKPNIIINCAATSHKLWYEEHPEEAYALHSLGARNLAIMAHSLDAHLIYLSSDFVFDGASTQAYTEFDTPNPQTVYGKTKLIGEDYVKSFCNKYTIIRSSWLYGKRYLYEIIEQAKQGQVTIHKDIIGTPTSSLELAEEIIHLFNTNGYGTFHVSCEGETSIRTFIQKILDTVGLEAEIIESDQPSRFEELRPRYSVLDNMMLRMTHQPPMKNWEDALERFISERRVKK
ncbi:NAD(P)-dependent oxidoreductase [Facklamia sp. DSM 111018]|uniref:dTDP-4-dehydrorhamnose reductase n=1 Tax=Facklamia lactis TaxID=2749967 RepID=A0ABS0LSY8_9LACT|nr:NAD(P)-dependent oxidoreductase [Facklamia lactis]MBG9987283.1 NAD(P)-dependent oxidoreductase [Facklamia lactis]